MEQQKPQRILPPEVVWDRVNLRKTAIKDRVREGSFPKPVRLGANRVGWLEADIDNWILQMAQQTR